LDAVYPAFQHLLHLVDIGVIGEVHTITADFGFRVDANAKPRTLQKLLGAGSLLDIGIYPIYLAQTLLGSPDTIQATATFTDQGIDDSCAMLLGWGTDKRAILHSTIKTTTRTEAWVHGTLGAIHIHTRFHHPHRLSIHKDNQIETIEMPYHGHGLHFEAQAAIDAIKSGQIEHPLVSYRQSIELSDTMSKVMEQIGLVY
jgi:predicted dehydrogenase